MAMNWSEVQMLSDKPETTVEATVLTVPFMKRRNSWVMLPNMPLADMAPPKHMAQMMSQMVFNMPHMPRVETSSFRVSLPVSTWVLS